MECMQRKKEPVLGFGVDLYTFEDSLQFVHQCLKENKGMHIVTINPEMIALGRKNDEFGRVINEADLVIPDGVGVKLALKIKGINQENIPGIEFSKKLMSICELEGFTIGLLGAKEEVVQQAAKKLREEHENLNITYIRNGYFDEQEEVGGSFDVWSGIVKRAPELWQKLGLEWLYRTLKEPARFKRIFPALPLFLVRVIIESIREKLG